MEIKVQKDNFEKQSNAIKSDAELKLAEVQTLLETERDRFRIEVRFFDSLRVKRKKWVTYVGNRSASILESFFFYKETKIVYYW